MLAEDHDLPRETVAYLHALVGRGHNLIYSASGFNFRDWGRALFQTAPRRLRSDPALRIAAVVFWGAFLISALLAAGREGFAALVVTEPMLEQMDHMYAEPVDGLAREGIDRSDTMMAGFYIWHNAGIGLRCFAWGIVFGLGSLKELLYEGIILGTVFGHMATRPHAINFYRFVTAHSSFELTAIVLSGAAGLADGLGADRHQGAITPCVVCAARRPMRCRRWAPPSCCSCWPLWSRAMSRRRRCRTGQGVGCDLERGPDHRVPGAGRARGRRGHGGWPWSRRAADGQLVATWSSDCAGAAVMTHDQVLLPAGLLGAGLRSAGSLQDRRGLERRHEPGAEELRSGVRSFTASRSSTPPAHVISSQAFRRRVGRPGRALRLAHGMPRCRVGAVFVATNATKIRHTS